LASVRQLRREINPEGWPPGINAAIQKNSPRPNHHSGFRKKAAFQKQSKGGSLPEAATPVCPGPQCVKLTHDARTSRAKTILPGRPGAHLLEIRGNVRLASAVLKDF
jgi:hypothetical protein